MNRVEGTLTHAEAARRRWDVLVVGAGPAGSMAARGLALRGASVLLVDKAEFPRWKICGCCLNGAAVAALSQAGLGRLLRELKAPRLQEVHLMAGGRQARLPLPEGYSLSRERLDHALIAEALRAGAHFLPKTHAAWQAWRDDGADVRINGPDESAILRTGMILAADGLAAGFTRRIPGVRCRQQANARLGGGTTFESPDMRITPGTIHMAIGRGGYVGMVRLEDGRLNVAAAFDPSLVRAAGGLNRAAGRVLAEAGAIRLPEEAIPRWQGTPPLTRVYSSPASGRVLLIGDAAGYIEPFTGEGMAWALASGAAVVSLVMRALQNNGYDWRNDWMHVHRQLLGRQQFRCRIIASCLRHLQLTTIGIRMLGRMPSLARRYLHQLNTAAVLPA